LAQEKLARKLMAKITELLSAPILLLRNGVAMIKNHIICPAIEGVNFLWHRLSYAELLLIGLVSFIAGPHLKPYAVRLLAPMRATLLARLTALFHVQSARFRLMLGSALASLVSRLNDKAISDKRVLEQRRDAIADEIAAMRTALSATLTEVQHRAEDVAWLEAEQRNPAVQVPSSPTGSSAEQNLGNPRGLHRGPNTGQSRGFTDSSNSTTSGSACV
jgi:hypothetical protein